MKVLFINFGDKEAEVAAKHIKTLRQAGIPAQLYPHQAKMKKQMGLADAEKIPFVAIIGDDEMKNGTVALKDYAFRRTTHSYAPKNLLKYSNKRNLKCKRRSPYHCFYFL